MHRKLDGTEMVFSLTFSGANLGNILVQELFNHVNSHLWQYIADIGLLSQWELGFNLRLL